MSGCGQGDDDCPDEDADAGADAHAQARAGAQSIPLCMLRGDVRCKTGGDAGAAPESVQQCKQDWRPVVLQGNVRCCVEGSRRS